MKQQFGAILSTVMPSIFRWMIIVIDELSILPTASTPSRSELRPFPGAVPNRRADNTCSQSSVLTGEFLCRNFEILFCCTETKKHD